MAKRLTRLIARAWAGRCALLLLAACLVAAPLAGEAAAQVAAAEDCAADIVAIDGEGSGAPHSEHGHDHHAHSCGGCHLHLLNVRLSAPPAVRRALARQLPKLAEAPREAPPGGLFRPPRT